MQAPDIDSTIVGSSSSMVLIPTVIRHLLPEKKVTAMQCSHLRHQALGVTSDRASTRHVTAFTGSVAFCVGGCLPVLLGALFASTANAETVIPHLISLDVAGMM